ncbi:MAG: carboxypeptidase regulatory-like domain-containing protein, partial [Candidatus Methanoperedens sp.]|nr:carboxypeptidase regulatory-like domain-containing protein [Candidatus Methanoperedens sp.]
MVIKQEKTGHSCVSTGNFFILLLLSMILLSSAASAADTGWVAPSVNTGGTGVTSPTNAYADDTSYATFSSSSSNWNYYGYDLSSIPSGSAINGIELNALGIRSSGSGSNRYMTVRLSWNSGTTWTSYSTDTTEWDRNNVLDHILGGAADTWGHSWTRDEIVNNLRIQAQWMTSTNTGDLDFLPVRVYYTPGAGTTYSVSGYVTNASNSAAISGATVTAGTETAATGGTGYYSMLLPNGTYTITASKSGYNPNSISRTVSGAPVSNANIALTSAPVGTGGKVIVATNRYVVLDDPLTSGKSADTAAGFALPSGGSWSQNAWNGAQTTIKSYALVLSETGTPITNSPVVFTIRNWNNADTTTSTTINTDANGIASYSLDLNAKNYYGNWYVDASATAISKTDSTGFIYNWFGCNAGGCKNHGNNAPNSATSSLQNSPYTLGREGTTSRGDHRTSDSDCVGCHRGYGGVGGGNAFSGQATKTADVHTTNTCATCHGITISTHQTNALIKSCSDCHSWTNLSSESTMSTGTTPMSNYSGNVAATGHNPANAVPCIICHGPMHNITKPDQSLRLTKNNIVEDSHCLTCHTSYEKHNGGVGCTLCHSQDVHNIQVFSQTAGYVNKGSTYQGNCTNCHQNPTFLTTLKSAPKAGSYTGTAPQVQTPLNHSNDNGGLKWGNYWTTPKDACVYCHGDNKHIATRLGYAATAVGTDPIGGAIGSGTVCASCHNSTDNDYAAIMALLNPDPVAFKPGTNWNITGTDHATYGTTDADCQLCHGSLLSGSATISEFVHNVGKGGGGGSCTACHAQPPDDPAGITGNNTDGAHILHKTAGYGSVPVTSCDYCHSTGGSNEGTSHPNGNYNIQTNGSAN